MVIIQGLLTIVRPVLDEVVVYLCVEVKAFQGVSGSGVTRLVPGATTLDYVG